MRDGQRNRTCVMNFIDGRVKDFRMLIQCQHANCKVGRSLYLATPKRPSMMQTSPTRDFLTSRSWCDLDIFQFTANTCKAETCTSANRHLLPALRRRERIRVSITTCPSPRTSSSTFLPKQLAAMVSQRATTSDKGLCTEPHPQTHAASGPLAKTTASFSRPRTWRCCKV